MAGGDDRLCLSCHDKRVGAIEQQDCLMCGGPTEGGAMCGSCMEDAEEVEVGEGFEDPAEEEGLGICELCGGTYDEGVCIQCSALLGETGRRYAQGERLSSIVARMEEVTGQSKKKVLMKYLELGRDEVATIDALGIPEEPREKDRPSPDRDSRQALLIDMIQAEAKRFYGKFIDLMKQTPRRLRRLREMVERVRGRNPPMKNKLPRGYVDVIHKALPSREDLEAMCEGLIDDWEGELYDIGES